MPDDTQTPSELIVSAAILLHQAGKDQRAIEILLDAVADDPTFVPAHVLLGALYQAAGNFNDSEISYRKALELDPINSEALQGLGLFLISRKRYLEAAPYLRAYLQKVPADEKSIQGLVEASRNIPGRENDIEAVLQKAWQQSQDIKVGIQYARYLAYQNKYSTARTVLIAVVANSKTAYTLAELALVCINSGNLDDVIRYSREAVALDLSSDRAWRYLSQGLYRKGEFTEALEAIEHAMSIAPGQLRSRLDKAKILSKLNRFEDMLSTLDYKVERDKKVNHAIQKEWIVLRIVALINLNKYDEALFEANKARQKYVKDVDFLRLAITILTIQEKYEQVLDAIDSASDLIGENVDEFFFSRYEALLCLGQITTASELMVSFLSRPTEKEKIERLGQLGVALYLRGRRQESQELYRQLISVKSEYWQAVTNLGYILIGEGQHQEAEELLLKVSQSSKAGEYNSLACCDLAYLYCVDGKYEKAIEAANQVLNSKIINDRAFLRIPVWRNEQIQADPEPFPGHDINQGDNARACIALANWALKQYTIALETLQSITDDTLRRALENSFNQAGENTTSL